MRGTGSDVGATGGAAVGTYYGGPVGGTIGAYAGGEIGGAIEGALSGGKHCDPEQPGDAARCKSARAIADIRAAAAKATEQLNANFPGDDMFNRMAREVGSVSISCGVRNLLLDCEAKGFVDPPTIPHVHVPQGDAGEMVHISIPKDRPGPPTSKVARAAVGGAVGASVGAGAAAALALAGIKVAGSTAMGAGIGAGIGLALGALVGAVTGGDGR